MSWEAPGGGSTNFDDEEPLPAVKATVGIADCPCKEARNCEVGGAGQLLPPTELGALGVEGGRVAE